LEGLRRDPRAQEQGLTPTIVADAVRPATREPLQATVGGVVIWRRALPATRALDTAERLAMVRISSKATFFYKWVFPAIWFGGLGLVATTSLRFQGAFAFPMLVLPVMAVVGFFIMRALIFDLVDEVWDAGDALIVCNRGAEDRIALSDIKNVSYSSMTSPPRVTLSLRRQSAFGQVVTFCAPLRLIPLTTSPMIDKLIERIDAARRR
jgi:hypothetical protein